MLEGQCREWKSMNFETLLIEKDARGVATLTLNRPEKHNALNADMIAELTDAAGHLGTDPETRVVVLKGAGKSFCAGGDLSWMQEQMAADPETRAREAGKLAYMLQALNTMPKPLIGALQGNAFGGGVGMASVCDVAIAADHIKMGLTEVRLGLIPATIGPYVVARMGEGRARRVFFSSRLFAAPEAVELGLVAAAVPTETMDERIEAEIVPYLSAAPGAVAAAKALARNLGPRIDTDVIEMSIAALKAQWETDEAKTGIAAFFAKEKAPWVS